MHLIDQELLDMHATAIALAEYPNATLAEEYPLQERALAHCVTVTDWQDCLDAFGNRVVGSFVADWADDMATHPHLSEGIAFIDIDDANAVVAEWDDAGFWAVSFVTPEEAEEAIRDAYPCEDEDEDEDEDDA